MFQNILSTVLIAFMLSIAPVRAHHTALPEGMTEVQATWLWGFHTVPASITRDNSPYWYSYPHTDVEQIDNPAWTDVALKQIRPGAKAPAVLMLHGCTGLARGPAPTLLLLMKRGYAVFAPDSFARPGRTCNMNTLYKRTEELAYALDKIQQLPWVDSDRIVLMGVSQGGATVAQWDKPGFQAHVILADNCGGRQPPAPSGTPVLAVVGENDDYFAGSSCDITRTIKGSKSIVIAGANHDVVDLPESQAAIGKFLTTIYP
jgi:dienelactone hydrolase